jgi:predicted O-linked N-acetylglucosamine transferase (SPINDLY family)
MRRACYGTAVTDAARTLEAALQQHRAGHLEEAERLYRLTLAADPRNADAAFLLGAVALQAGELTEAIKALRLATTIDPAHAPAHSNLGEAYRRLGRIPEAIASLVKAVRVRPDLAEPVYNLGLVLRAAGERDAAVRLFRHAARVNPDIPAIGQALTEAMKDADPPEDGTRSVPANVPLASLLELAHLENALGEHEAAVALCGRVLDRRPSDREALALLVDACLTSGLVDQAVPALRRCLDVEEIPPIRSLLVLTLAYDPNADDRAIAEEAKTWDRLHGAQLTSRARPHANDRSPRRRLRVGYVSSFRDGGHKWFLGPLWSNHDKSELEVFCYSGAAAPDPDIDRLRPFVDTWRETARLDDRAMVARIRDDAIDVLVDLNMHTVGGRLAVFARKPAPVQICWLAYPGTTGLGAMDYRVTDPHLDPAADDASFYSERSLRLPETFWCYEPGPSTPDVGPLPALEQGRVTFGCLNSHAKLNSGAFALWARILEGVSGSSLLLLAPPNDMRERVSTYFADRGVDPARIVFVTTAARAAYLAYYQRTDIGLDPFPCNGHTTTLDALWMGVPVVTLRMARKVVGRAGATLAANVGMPELVADTADEYVRIAVELAADRSRLRDRRSALRGRLQASPLMDGRRFAKNMEALFREAWGRWCNRPEPSCGG